MSLAASVESSGNDTIEPSEKYSSIRSRPLIDDRRQRARPAADPTATTPHRRALCIDALLLCLLAARGGLGLRGLPRLLGSGEPKAGLQVVEDQPDRRLGACDRDGDPVVPAHHENGTGTRRGEDLRQADGPVPTGVPGCSEELECRPSDLAGRRVIGE